MKHITRVEFLRGLFLGVGGTAMLATLAYITFSFIKGLTNVTSDGWGHIGYLFLIFFSFYTIAILISHLIKKYKKQYGKAAQANIIALSLTLHMVAVGISSGFAVKALYEGRLDNIIMWSILIAFNLYHTFKEVRLRVLNG